MKIPKPDAAVVDARAVLSSWFESVAESAKTKRLSLSEDVDLDAFSDKYKKIAEGIKAGKCDREIAQARKTLADINRKLASDVLSGRQFVNEEVISRKDYAERRIRDAEELESGEHDGTLRMIQEVESLVTGETLPVLAAKEGYRPRDKSVFKTAIPKVRPFNWYQG